ncbi:MAG: polyprenol monophosphomannose synthase [bacterium]|nr:polyprenol monophosphomannose synthase [bacterium]
MNGIVVTPTFNERDNIEELIHKIRTAAPGLHVLVVDDNSPDGTGDLADQLASQHAGEVGVLHRDQKEGLGRAYVAGFRHVLERGYDVIIQMDADLSHDPSYLPGMLAAIEQADLVLGSRYLSGINVVNWDFKRLILSKTATRYIRIVTGMPFSDATGGFKCWRRETLEAIDLDQIFSNGYVFQVETTYKTYRQGLRITEVPIIFYERNLGDSKMDLGIIFEALWGVWKLRFKY